MLARLRRSTRTQTNPVFYRDRLEALLADQPDRLDRMLHDPRNVDVLTWNVLATLDSDPDRDYLATLLQPLAGSDLRAPLRLALWTGRHREPRLQPSTAYVRHLRDRVGGEDELATYTQPIEVPVRIEAPGLLVLADTALDAPPRGAGGRDRFAELVDAGLEHARHLSTTLVVGAVYASGTRAAAELSARVNTLRDPTRLAAALPWHEHLPEVRFRELSWQELLRRWEREREHYRLFGQPVRAFLDYATALGVR